MNFKGHVSLDIPSVFIDLDEFASAKVINGVSVNVVEDKDQLNYRIKQDYNGLVIGDVLIYISAEEYAKIPKMKPVPTADQILRYAGIPMVITDVAEQEGVYEIILRNAGGY